MGTGHGAKNNEVYISDSNKNLYSQWKIIVKGGGGELANEDKTIK